MLSQSVLSSGKFFLSLLFIFIPLYTDGLAQNLSTLTHHSLLNIGQSDNARSILDIEPTDNLRIIAVMVEFQPDDNRFTSGNGTFESGSIPYLEDPGTNVDALPHNQAYFEAHLSFVKNYFEKNSNNQFGISFQVLPNVYRLDNKMEKYSPIGQNPDFHPLAELAKDVWNLVGNDSSVQFEKNQNEKIAFVIFHAGIGRDVELTGTTLDKTPQDIPSVYLSKNAFKELFNDPSFSGFEIGNTNLLVDHSLILPRTLSRSGVDFSDNRFVIPLSINGLLTALIGRHIGLPELFNTETGNSGIGRFGLMDGAGIFAYNGLFPPELSAWEKIQLGWQEPFEVNYDQQEPIELPASSLRKQSSIAKISLSNSEYFLIENRHRDPENSGIVLTIQRPDGSIVEQSFSNRDSDFVNQTNDFDKLLEPGVIIDVSNYDFALPGGLVNEGSEKRDLNGGILIWHIDETVIRKQINTIGVNRFPDRKGVELKEADGAQDIGRPTNIGIAQNDPNGSAFDFWWSGNNSSVIFQSDTLSLYQNRFGPDTFPDNRSHTGALSPFEIFDFSNNLPIASFKIRETTPENTFFDLKIRKTLTSITTATSSADPYWSRYPLAIQSISAADSQDNIIIPGMDGLILYNLETNRSSPFNRNDDYIQQPLSGFNDAGFLAVSSNPLRSVDEMKVSIYNVSDEIPTLIGDYTTVANTGFLSTSEPDIIDLDGTSVRIDINSKTLLLNSSNQQSSEIIGRTQSLIKDNQLVIRSAQGTVTHPISPSNTFTRAHTGLVQSGDGMIFVYLLLDDKLSLFSPANQYSNEIILENRDRLEWPAIVDLNDDGNPDFLYVNQTGNKLIGKNVNGAMLDGFPITPLPGNHFTGTPLVADLDGDEYPDLLIPTDDTISLFITAYRSDTKLMEGFPLLVGGLPSADHQLIHPMLKNRQLIAVSPENDLKIWNFPKMGKIQWASKYGNSTDNKVTGLIEPGETKTSPFTLLNSSETYNWPNPAIDETFIRYQTESAAIIRIRITTMSGRLISDRRMQSVGGLPEELRIDTSSWASGAYYALLEATSGNTTERKLIKIAIVR
tara:strand:+ start:43866 stop:47075 length:3210 start_codon:yes stop_codon:yes gene_type:complete